MIEYIGCDCDGLDRDCEDCFGTGVIDVGPLPLEDEIGSWWEDIRGTEWRDVK